MSGLSLICRLVWQPNFVCAGSSVAAELFYADVVAVHTGVGEHRLKISDHLRRTRNVSKQALQNTNPGVPLLSDADPTSDN